MNNNIKNVLEWLEQTAERLPDKTAFDDGNEQIRFEDVRDKAQKIGAGLVEQALFSRGLDRVLDHIAGGCLAVRTGYHDNFHA